ncbi:hypothetical protein G4X40_10400 [Rhodococcus sp. D2-41]|uniref:Lipoprotein with Yx(FWY)xxD motif n=1 Tax=Speluncibacter jeojiensis TaxID=2710754 RepID=A0A9X4LZ59_9ACTN|nr:hypothetical protein [Rhodococcus sp. D2-41]MDG3010558.1 hypothetical protein [Rhodococcus sp. D2-41]MDG3014306.1 hypothetical protein [Corynebacteriales bacterium D3-21]
MRQSTRVLAVAFALSGGLAVAACGSAGPWTPPAHPAVVSLHRGGAGGYLIDGGGSPLYVFARDINTVSVCNWTCSARWLPLTTAGSPDATLGVDGDLLGTTDRQDGTTQVTYRGHPLYRLVGDRDPDSAAGAGRLEFGGRWWLVSPAGDALTGGGPVPLPLRGA